jgi:hypothetical protein
VRTEDVVDGRGDGPQLLGLAWIRGVDHGREPRSCLRLERDLAVLPRPPGAPLRGLEDRELARPGAAGHRLTALLREHILIAVKILGDVKSGDSAALGKDNAAWYANANRISAFLHAANPHHWPLGALRKMMHCHLKLTTNEAVAELTGNFGASVHAYDMVEHEILGMADMLSTGIIAQFPGRFS